MGFVMTRLAKVPCVGPTLQGTHRSGNPPPAAGAAAKNGRVAPRLVAVSRRSQSAALKAWQNGASCLPLTAGKWKILAPGALTLSSFSTASTSAHAGEAASVVRVNADRYLNEK
jgi:hypothetical protein